MFMILTASNADKVRGLSTKGNALAPVPLKDGSFILPLQVLNDPAHAAYATILKALPMREVTFGTAGATPSDPIVGGEVVTDPVLIAKYSYKSDWLVGEVKALDTVKIGK